MGKNAKTKMEKRRLRENVGFCVLGLCPHKACSPASRCQCFGLSRGIRSIV